jgi:hypothetical protein
MLLQAQLSEGKSLRPFQAEDIPWFLNHPRSGNLSEPRLGKTVVTSITLALDPLTNKVLIACPKNAMFVWRDHLLEWFQAIAPHRTLDIRVVKGKGAKAAQQRKQAWLAPTTADVTCYIVTWGALDRDIQLLQLPSTSKSGLIFNTVIGDEVHFRLKNRKNKAAKYFKWLTHPQRCRRFHPLSGTLAGKGGPADFWPLLNMINPTLFGSYWKFVNTYMVVGENGWGGKELIEPKNIDHFHRFILEAYFRRRFRHICAPQMPKVQRDLLKVEATPEQVKLLEGLDQESFVFTPSDELIVAATSMEKVLRVRQILTCPQILDSTLGVGAAMEDLTERLLDPEMSPTEDDRHVVIFSAFRQALQPFEDYLRTQGFENIFQLYGGIDPEILHQRINQFKQSKGIILCSIKYAQAFSLAPAQQCFTIGYEWDPNDNKQAEDRLVPQEGINPINSYYYCYPGIDDGVAESVNIKNRVISLTLGKNK